MEMQTGAHLKQDVLRI